jgi:hypothetical protein
VRMRITVAFDIGNISSHLISCFTLQIEQQ